MAVRTRVTGWGKQTDPKVSELEPMVLADELGRGYEQAGGGSRFQAWMEGGTFPFTKLANARSGVSL